MRFCGFAGFSVLQGFRVAYDNSGGKETCFSATLGSRELSIQLLKSVQVMSSQVSDHIWSGLVILLNQTSQEQIRNSHNSVRSVSVHFFFQVRSGFGAVNFGTDRLS